MLTPIAMHGQNVPADSLQVAPIMIKEVTIGLAFSLAIGILAAGVQAAGGLLDTLVGFSFGALIDPFDNSPAAILGQLYSIFATMIFLLTGGDQIMVLGLAKSYDIVPLGGVPTTSHLAALATTGLAQVFVVALEIAAPVVIALLLADIAFALVSRAVPQMNVFAVGTPAKVLIGFATVAASLPFLADAPRGPAAELRPPGADGDARSSRWPRTRQRKPHPSAEERRAVRARSSSRRT